MQCVRRRKLLANIARKWKFAAVSESFDDWVSSTQQAAAEKSEVSLKGAIATEQAAAAAAAEEAARAANVAGKFTRNLRLLVIYGCGLTGCLW